MDTYGGDINKLYDTFVQFLHNLPFYGAAVLCVDDEGVNAIRARIRRPVVTYGIESEQADYRAINIVPEGQTMTFRVERRAPHSAMTVTLNSPGKHNVLNALGAIAVATEEGVSDEAIMSGLAHFAGVGRRFQVFEGLAGFPEGALLVDDYGHHPSELRVTIEAARQCWPDRRLVMAFQPHRFSRTRDLFDDFVEVLSAVDQLLLLPVYSAGESTILGATSRDLARALQSDDQSAVVTFMESESHLHRVLKQSLKAKDVLMVQGAGNVGLIAQELISDGLI